MAENIRLIREGLCITGGKGPAKELVGCDSGHRNPKIRAASSKNEKNFDALHMEGGMLLQHGALQIWNGFRDIHMGNTS